MIKRQDGKDVYFAKLTDDQEYLDALHSKIQLYFDHVEFAGLYDLWKRAYIAFYGGDLNSCTNIFESSRLTKDGKAGQVTKVKVNNYRNLVKHAITLATANKASLTCVSQNTDQKSQAQTILGDSLLDYYLTTNKVGSQHRQAVEYGCLMGEGWLHLPWEPKKGEIYSIDEKKNPVYEGDLDITYHSPLDVIREVNLREPKFPWLILKKMVNKFDLIARYPKLEEEILMLTDQDNDYLTSQSFRFEITKSEDEETSDFIPLWTFYHDKTEAVPNGRVTIFAGDIVLFDGALPYETIPLLSVMPDILHQSGFGYSPYNDLLGLQQAHDNLLSTSLTNNLTFGKQFIWMSNSSDDLNVSSLEGGLKLIKSNVRPEGLNLTHSAPELLSNLNMIGQEMETISGISSTIRGKPESNIQSGTAMALVVAQSVQFGSQLEESSNNLLVDVGEMIISHLKSFAKTPRLAFVVGISKQPYMKQFTSEDITDIKRVTVQQISAMSKTVSGRVDLAEKIMKIPEDKVAQFMSVVNTGQLPPGMQSHDPEMNIKAENEKLLAGEQVQVIVTENHFNHIKQHTLLLENPNSKEDPNLVGNTLEHIQSHLNEWKGMDPALAQITGQQPPPAQQGPSAGMASPGAGQAVQPPTQTQGPEGEPNQPNMPGLPPGTDPGSQAAYESTIKGEG